MQKLQLAETFKHAWLRLHNKCRVWFLDPLLSNFSRRTDCPFSTRFVPRQDQGRTSKLKLQTTRDQKRCVRNIFMAHEGNEKELEELFALEFKIQHRLQ